MHVTAKEIDRFWSRVVKGTREADCWLWARDGAAIGDDGYGRFRSPETVASVSFDASGSPGSWPKASRSTCILSWSMWFGDNPICVPVDGALLDHHLERSTQAPTLAWITQHAQPARFGAWLTARAVAQTAGLAVAAHAAEVVFGREGCAAAYCVRLIAHASLT